LRLRCGPRTPQYRVPNRPRGGTRPDARLPRSRRESGRESGRASTAPGAKRAGIQVNEIRLPVIADSAAGQSQGMPGQIRAIDAREPHIDGASLEVQAVPRNAAAAFAQLFVGLRRTIARNY